MQEYLYAAIVAGLRADTGEGSLVSITGHNSTTLRIARDQPPVKDRTPFLGVDIIMSMPLMGSDVTNLQKARVEFKSYSRVEPLVIQLADRLETLLHSKNDNVSYLDFTNSTVSTRSTRFKTRSAKRFDRNTEVWTIVVEADIIWHYV